MNLALQNKWNIDIRAALWSIAVHLVLLFFFMLFQYKIAQMQQQVADGGLEINLGTSDNGEGNDQPLKRGAPSEYQATVVYKNSEVKSAVPKNIMQTNDATAPEIASSDKKKDANPEESRKDEPQQKPRYAYGGETGPGGNGALENVNGKNEGNTGGQGDRGVPNGTPGAPNYSGVPGNGTGGIGHTLSGRQISPDRFDAEFNENGRVVIHVTVDRSGNIVNKYVVSSSNSQLTKIALEKLKDAHFSKSDGSEPQQFGDITIVFKSH